ncbi:MAG TPA: hypothetical protein GXZ82_06650 [Firmicutes bacterium]|jgi:hypothetical protein|nr:hypothetical protein [Bacillota bacterium]
MHTQPFAGGGVDVKAEVYVDRLFEGYEPTPELLDFKEEITVNLIERIKELQNKGLDPEVAFEKAVAELGDITKIADQISRNKRNEVISKMYFRSKPELDKAHVIGYIASAGVLLFGIVASLIIFYSQGDAFAGVAALLPFLVPSGGAFVFLRLTQETGSRMPMRWQRALLYGISTSSIIFGINTSVMLYFSEQRDFAAVFGTLIPFVIPGLCLIAYLFLTEKSLRKPWVEEGINRWMERHTDEMADPRHMEQRRLLSGALWLLAIALFVTLGFIVGFQYSWVTFLFAVAGELVIEYRLRAGAR